MENADSPHTAHFQSVWRKMICVLAAFWLLGHCSCRADEDRLWVDVKINGKPVRLAFDTGASFALLFRPTAESLGLRITNAPANARLDPGEVPAGWTEPVDVNVGNRTIRFSFAVIDVPEAMANQSQTRGVFGWANVAGQIIHIDGENRRCESLDRVPKAAAKWPRFPLRLNSDILTVSLPDRSSGRKYVVLDTGLEGVDVAVCPVKWNQWADGHPNFPRTFDAYFMPGAGLVVNEVSWTDELSLGKLKLTNLKIEKANSAQNDMGGPDFLASLGLHALKQLDIVVDAGKGFIYMRTNGVTSAPEHNRIGAVFTPETLETDDLRAHVLDGSPAYEAGIRSGDILLAIDGTDATKWRTDSTTKSSFWERAPGTKTHLKLKRGEKKFETDVVLRNLIGPDLKPAAQNTDSPPAH